MVVFKKTELTHKIERDGTRIYQLIIEKEILIFQVINTMLHFI